MTDPLCTCDLETSFSVVDDRQWAETYPWFVMDAECEEVARCKEHRFAVMIAKALNECEKNYTVCFVAHEKSGDGT